MIVSPPVFHARPPCHADRARRTKAAVRGAAGLSADLEEVPKRRRREAASASPCSSTCRFMANLRAGALGDLSWRAYRLADGQWGDAAANRGGGWVRVEAPQAAAATGLSLDENFTSAPFCRRNPPWWSAPSRVSAIARFQQFPDRGPWLCFAVSRQPLISASFARCCSPRRSRRRRGRRPARPGPNPAAGPEAPPRSRARPPPSCSQSPSTARVPTNRWIPARRGGGLYLPQPSCAAGESGAGRGRDPDRGRTLLSRRACRRLRSRSPRRRELGDRRRSGAFEAQSDVLDGSTRLR